MSAGPDAGGYPSGVGRWLAIAASVVVVLAVGTAIFLMRSPSAQREVTLDNRRVQDLQTIVQLVDVYVSQNDELPADMDALAQQPGQWVPKDPVDGSAYEYEVAADRAYRLCASFTTDTAVTADRSRGGVEWNHAAGRQCFDRKAGKAAAVD